MTRSDEVVLLFMQGASVERLAELFNLRVADVEDVLRARMTHNLARLTRTPHGTWEPSDGT